MIKNIAIFGSTGSIGENTLAVIRLHSDQYQVFALTGYHNSQLLIKQCLEFNPKFAFIKPQLHNQVQLELKKRGSKTEVLSSSQDLIDLATSDQYRFAVVAIVGSFGLLVTYHAVATAKILLLANKEALVMAGELIINTANINQTTIIPIDSEHSAIYQALNNPKRSLSDNKVNKLILTASGGPLYKLSTAEMKQVTKQQALNHPVWKMGAKISIDSATLMNKGLELIEAFWLFEAKLDQLSAIIHPQHIIHSMVEYIDGSIIAHLSVPDMKIPIAYALSLADRIKSGVPFLDFNQYNRLDFTPIDQDKFPCFKLALDSLKLGGAASLILTVINEIAVAKFLQDKISFIQIPSLIESTVEKFYQTPISSLEDIVNITEQIYRRYS